MVTATAAAALIAIGQAGVGSAQAAQTVTVAPLAYSPNSNTFPFGQGNVWGQYLGFVYKDLPAFKLNPGDTLGFDLNRVNDVNVQVRVELAPTSSNGGDAPAGAFTTLAGNTQIPANPTGNTITGDYELRFSAEAPFSFPGGGLIIRISDPGGAFATDTVGQTVLDGNLAASTDASGLFVSRYRQDADGLPPYGSVDLDYIAPFRLVIDPPNDISFGKVRRNKKAGSAILPVTVPGPGQLTLSGKGLRAVAATATGASSIDLRLAAKGRTRKRLRRAGKAKVKPNVTFAPTNGDPNTESASIKLKKKLKKKRRK